MVGVCFLGGFTDANYDFRPLLLDRPREDVYYLSIIVLLMDGHNRNRLRTSILAVYIGFGKT